MSDYSIKLLSEDDSTAVFGGYGVIFGGEDMQGDTFTKNTRFGLRNGVGQEAYIDHSLDDEFEVDGTIYRLKGVKDPVGEIVEVSPDDIGLYMRVKVEKQKKYWEIVNQMYKTGKMGYSTGSAPHLVRRVKNTSHLDYWPIKEVSFTLNPAEPRTTQHTTRLKTAPLHDETTGPEAKAADVQEQADNETIIQEPIEMSEQEVQEQEVKTAPTVDLGPVLEAVKALGSRLEAIENQPINEIKAVNKAPAVLKHGRGDTEAQAFKAWASGDSGETEFEVKASNATDMNIGTAADGGNLVPTGFYNQIITRRDETSLKARLPLMNVPGVGTTVDVPIDNEADGEFVATAEAATFDLDAPAVSKKSLTLAKYTKYVDVSYELLEDTPTRLEAFLADFVGRGMAKTDNNLLITEVAANGTNFKTFAGAAAIAFGEPEDIIYNNDLSPYLEDDNAIAWVMRSSTLGDIKSIVGNDRQYSMNVDGANRQLLGYPVYYSQKAPAVATGNKSVYFGNWRYVAYREAPSLTFLRDPYTVAVSGQVRLLWHYRVVFGVLQSEAIGYGTQA